MNAWFFWNLDDDFFFKKWWWWSLLKMNKTWANAPSLEHEFISLGKKKKNLDLTCFWKQWCKWWFLKTNEMAHQNAPVWPKKKSFWVLNDPKKMFENAKLHGIAWKYDGGIACHLAHEKCHSALLERRLALWKCRLALLECRMALGHAIH